ncbi:CDP-alcohol phosphatidyltransferase family protein [Rhizobium sp. YIM 134829]|uniref:CDP-alcohol phosphatidyltransferase family protein n=1 Tax=Rhizobium sp. YIM 134829 TaxID=3390453 RepID=UPI003978DEEF
MVVQGGTRRKNEGGAEAALQADAQGTLFWLFAGTGVAAGLATWLLSLGWLFVVSALLPLALIYTLALRGLDDHPHARFGKANVITALRAAMTCLVAAALLCLDGLADQAPAMWGLAAFVLVALALDGVDGALARRSGLDSAFGARFDMEVDAFLILVLSAGATLLGKAGLWVLLIGLLRYAFVLAGWLDPRLTQPLFPSFRRKLVCVVQILCLCLLLLPVVVPPLSTLIAAAALVSLLWSFARDTLFLLRQAARSV